MPLPEPPRPDSVQKGAQNTESAQQARVRQFAEETAESLVELANRILQEVAEGRAVRGKTELGTRPTGRVIYATNGDVFIMLPTMVSDDVRAATGHLLVAHYKRHGYRCEEGKAPAQGAIIRL